MGFPWFISLLLSWHRGAFEGQDWFTAHGDGLPNQISLGFFFAVGIVFHLQGKRKSHSVEKECVNGIELICSILFVDIQTF